MAEPSPGPGAPASVSLIFRVSFVALGCLWGAWFPVCVSLRLIWPRSRHATAGSPALSPFGMRPGSVQSPLFFVCPFSSLLPDHQNVLLVPRDPGIEDLHSHPETRYLPPNQRQWLSPCLGLLPDSFSLCAEILDWPVFSSELGRGDQASRGQSGEPESPSPS